MQDVPEVGKNFVSGMLLNKEGFKLAFECNKVVITKHNMFVGIGYIHDSLFKLSTISNFNNISSMIMNTESQNI